MQKISWPEARRQRRRRRLIPMVLIAMALVDMATIAGAISTRRAYLAATQGHHACNHADRFAGGRRLAITSDLAPDAGLRSVGLVESGEASSASRTAELDIFRLFAFPNTEVPVECNEDRLRHRTG